MILLSQANQLLPTMKTISIRLTDKQHHYIAALSKDQKRSIEHLIWLSLSQGIDYLFSETPYHVEKLHCDFSEKDHESMDRHPLHMPSAGYYDESCSLFGELADNVLADIDGTFEAEDAKFDLQLAISHTKALHATRKKDFETKQAAKKEAAK